MTMFLGIRNSKDILLILPDVTGSRKSKMTAVKPELPLYQLLDKIATPFQRLPHTFGVQELNGNIEDTTRCKRKSGIKDGGHQTGSTCNSASRQDSNKIPNAMTMFSGTRNSTALLRTLPDVTRNQ
jgi:hypothetical protein